MEVYVLDKRNVFPSKISSCRKQVSDWKTRLYHEFCTSSVSFMVTLTIDDTFMPEVDGDPTRCCQLFIKRLRRNMSYDFHKIDKSLSAPKFKNFLISEYGEKTNRLHFHVLFMFETWINPAYFKKRLQRDWYYGFTQLKPLRDIRGISYVTKYISKKYIQDTVKLQSNFIGLTWFLRNVHLFRKQIERGERPTCHVNGFEKSLPRYYLKRLLLDTSLYKMHLANINNVDNLSVEWSVCCMHPRIFVQVKRLCEVGFFPEPFTPHFLGHKVMRMYDGFDHVECLYDIPNVLLCYFESNVRDRELLNDFQQRKYNYEEFRKRAHL